jgi:MerR family transcriptional regulator, copper efflux regulator
MRIGEVARRAEVRVDTVRFYERRGLLAKPARRPSGYRDYPASAVERLRFAKQLQGLGFTLDEVAEVLADFDAGLATCAGERPRFQAVLARIDRKLAELGAVRARLTGALDRCAAGTCGLGRS